MVYIAPYSPPYHDSGASPSQLTLPYRVSMVVDCAAGEMHGITEHQDGFTER